jgi:hypothetical protein
VQEFRVLRVLEPALRMKAQTDSNSRGRKDFICSEFICRKEKRKTAYWGMQGDPETSDPMGPGGEWDFFLYCLRAEVPFRCRRAFPREERCLLDHLSPFGTSCSLSFTPMQGNGEDEIHEGMRGSWHMVASPSTSSSLGKGRLLRGHGASSESGRMDDNVIIIRLLLLLLTPG